MLGGGETKNWFNLFSFVLISLSIILFNHFGRNVFSLNDLKPFSTFDHSFCLLSDGTLAQDLPTFFKK